MIDVPRVRTKLAALDGYLHRLEQLAQLDTPSYLAQHRYEGRYLTQACAQVCIDLANHLIASRGWAPAQEFREAFTRLAEHEVLDDQHAGRMKDLAGLRNRLVHLYDEVDDRLVHDALRAGTPDLRRFATVAADLATRGSSEESDPGAE